MVLNEKKIVIAQRTGEIRFLGYTFKGDALYRPTAEWFSRLLAPERDIKTLENSAARLLAFYKLGGY